MPRMIDEAEKRRKRAASRRASNITALVGRGYPREDAAKVYDALDFARGLAAAAKLVKQMEPALAKEARELNRVAVISLESAVGIARKHVPADAPIFDEAIAAAKRIVEAS